MLKEKQIMPPPWIAYPEIERYSIGWRMGYGEDYIMKWGEWFDALMEVRDEIRRVWKNAELCNMEETGR